MHACAVHARTIRQNRLCSERRSEMDCRAGCAGKAEAGQEYKIVELPAFRFADRSAYSETWIPVRREWVQIV